MLNNHLFDMTFQKMVIKSTGIRQKPICFWKDLSVNKDVKVSHEDGKHGNTFNQWLQVYTDRFKVI